jgi:two-component system, LytTR family, sensor kinase
MIAELSDLLRRMLDDSTRQQVPLQEETAFAQKYLDIQKVRFMDHLQVDADVPGELNLAQVPSSPWQGPPGTLFNRVLSQSARLPAY